VPHPSPSGEGASATAAAPALAPQSEPAPAQIIVGDIFAHTELVAAPVFEAGAERTRPNLKVQDGCDNRCSFCIIPYVRGQNRSLPLDEVLREVDTLVSAGYREVVISGINLGRWGRDFEKKLRFEDLVCAIAEKTALERLRISSVEPMDWSNELIGLVASSPRIAKHAHVPMQSGSDRILRKMHRKYRPWHYAEKLMKMRKAMQTAAIGADVMVGFPGETDLDFEETRAMIEQLPFTYLHVFTYSGRPGTPSAAMPDQVPVHIARERNRILREMAAEKKLRFMKSFVGQTLSAITLSVQESSCTEALTDNYLKLWLKGSHRENQLIQARIEEVGRDSLIGSN
jgi:threonylcarbamoyladenosine tRNA methylthiotransferase MtaB